MAQEAELRGYYPNRDGLKPRRVMDMLLEEFWGSLSATLSRGLISNIRSGNHVLSSRDLKTSVNWFSNSLGNLFQCRLLSKKSCSFFSGPYPWLPLSLPRRVQFCHLHNFLGSLLLPSLHFLNVYLTLGGTKTTHILAGVFSLVPSTMRQWPP